MYMHCVNLSYVLNKLNFSYRKHTCYVNLGKNTLLLLIIFYKRDNYRRIRFSQDEVHKITPTTASNHSRAVVKVTVNAVRLI